MIDSYNTTLRALVDKHVPLRTRRSQERRSARWFDRECRESKRLTRKLNDGIAECARLMPKPLGVSNSTHSVIFFSQSLLRFGCQRLKAVSKTRASTGKPSTPCFIRRGSTTHANCLQLILPVFCEAKWPIYGLPQHLRHHLPLTHCRCHLSVSFSRRLLRRSLVSSTRCPPNPVHCTLFLHGS